MRYKPNMASLNSRNEIFRHKKCVLLFKVERKKSPQGIEKSSEKYGYHQLFT